MTGCATLTGSLSYVLPCKQQMIADCASDVRSCFIPCLPVAAQGTNSCTRMHLPIGPEVEFDVGSELAFVSERLSSSLCSVSHLVSSSTLLHDEMERLNFRVSLVAGR